MPVIDHLFAVGSIRKVIWKFWYPYLTRKLRGEEVLFLNYAYEESPPMGIPLAAKDEENRACIQLYHHVAAQVPLRGKRVLEVSCGHGGGAAYIARTFQPQRYTGLDLNPEAIAFCQKRHQLEGLDFRQGDAENLPFEAETLDAVVNVEASHCYPNFPRFVSEVARVLRPGGNLLHADFRFSDRLAEWEQALASAPLKTVANRVINPEVQRGMERNSERSLALIQRHLPKFLRGLGRDFAGTKGSRIHTAVANGELTYRSYCLQKPDLKSV